jgi:pyruvate/oxaloacetate carboxyltransferase
MLFRSTAINAMSNLPHDVIDAFIKNSVDAGMDVFTNFDAHNDPRNHRQVAEGVIKHGAALTLTLTLTITITITLTLTLS